MKRLSGLFLVTVATLVLEILDSRLLSALTWYHLAFFAVSLAMLGMAAGAVFVFLGGERFENDAALEALPKYARWLALSMPATHLLNLVIPIPTLETFSGMELAALTFSTLALGLPFFLSGVVVTLALTRTKGDIGKLYAADLLGASLGCLLVIPLLAATNLTSAVFVAAAIAAIGAWCFGAARSTLVLAGTLLVIAGINTAVPQGLGVVYSKNRNLRTALNVGWSAWNTHSYVIITRPLEGAAYYWGAGKGTEGFEATSSIVLIDGEAGTPITKWDGDPASLDWVSYDVTALPYHLRHGAVGIIGVGGGRDVLAALWGRNTPITGIEINDSLLRALNGPYRDFAHLAGHPGVELIHGEARSVLSRSNQTFDVLQMSLIDTWAATGAGAFTLSENGLYTLEAWDVFLSRLKPGGVFSVSRWFAPTATSETSRLLALATASLLQRGVAVPANQVVMVARGTVATLMVSQAPFTDEDRRRIETVAEEKGFRTLVAPWAGEPDAFLTRIVASTSRKELDLATASDDFDFSPPTDERPFFFNTLKPGSYNRAYQVARDGVMWGNLRATWTLVALFILCFVLVLWIIVWPLARRGLPAMDKGTFGVSVVYFATIGAGFMLIQIPFLQRFSVYLGHPTYTLAVILFSMIFFAGVGSYLSGRFPIKRLIHLPLVLGAAVLAMTFVIQPLIDATISLGLLARCALVVLAIAPIATLAGFCFPMGMTLVGKLSSSATAWMWGVNGAVGVLASIAAVAISMWLGIHMNFVIAGLLYLSLALPLRVLSRRAGL